MTLTAPGTDDRSGTCSLPPKASLDASLKTPADHPKRDLIQLQRTSALSPNLRPRGCCALIKNLVSDTQASSIFKTIRHLSLNDIFDTLNLEVQNLMNEKRALEQRFEYRMKPVVLGLFLVVSPVAIFFGFLGASPLFKGGPYTLSINDDIFTGAYAIFLSVVLVGLSIAWISGIAFMFHQERLCSKEVVLGATKILVPLTVAGEVNKSLPYEQLTRTHLRSSDEGQDFVIATKKRQYLFESRRFASTKEFELFCATIEERRNSSRRLNDP